MKLPASTVHRIFLRHNLVREQCRIPAAVRRFEREAPNQLWQMDFKGPKAGMSRWGRFRCWTIILAT